MNNKKYIGFKKAQLQNIAMACLNLKGLFNVYKTLCVACLTFQFSTDNKIQMELQEVGV